MWSKLVPVVFLCLAGCNRVITEQDVCGRYELKHPAGDVLLELRSDHIFVETITTKSGTVFTKTSDWFWGPIGDSGMVNLNRFGDVTDAHVLGAPTDTGLDAETEWGKIELCTYSLSLESDVCFKRIAPK